MKITKQFIKAALTGIGVSTELSDSDEFLDDLTRAINIQLETSCPPIFPKPDESLAVALDKPKTAALAFDRVYQFPFKKDPPPNGIGFFCSTASEIFAGCFVILATAFDECNELSKWKTELSEVSEKKIEQSSPNHLDTNLRYICSDFQTQYGLVPTFVYDNPQTFTNEFKSGKHTVITTSIAEIAMVDETELSWEQILEFRKDTEARAKYRRFVRWIDAELKSKSPKEVEDLVAIRLDDYTWTLQKHGLKSKLGTLSLVMDPKFLAGVSAAVAATSVAGGVNWGALAGASLVFGRMVLNFGTSTIDKIEDTRKENYEVAYIHEIQKKFGK